VTEIGLKVMLSTHNQYSHITELHKARVPKGGG